MAKTNITTHIGQRFTRWTVIGESYRQGNARVALCRCDCGTERLVRTERLHNGESKSCRCLFNESRTTHGKSTSREYAIWRGMFQRTTNPKHNRYANYGALGISVCERWESFENFYADMGPRPSKDHSIERRENSGNYEPGNCKWATRKEQAQNTSRNRFITANGKTMCLIEWERELGCSRYTIPDRISRGWTEERAVTTPVRKTPQ